ncbi:MAG: class I SAM-dependent methyltransferase [Nanoarchaeota archaeon]|nr:class I SAM-dependent methyltransferase [Nanoarchaeota archaeon]
MKSKYDSNVEFWNRDSKIIQSDFLCRPHVLKLLGGVKDKRILDAGCGEGYLSRILSNQGAMVVAIDSSRGMIEKAKNYSKENKVKYCVDSILSLKTVRKNSIDKAISVMVFNYLNKKSEWNIALRKIHGILKKSGEFVLALQHPFEIVHSPKTNWIDHIKNENKVYWDEKGIFKKLFDFRGNSFRTKNIHRTFSTILNKLIENGFEIKRVLEPKPSKKDLRSFKRMWGDEIKYPYYLIIKSIKK